MAMVTTTAVKVVRAAVEEARELRSRVVGQEHVLLALQRHPDCDAMAVLRALGLDVGLSTLKLWITPGAEPAAMPAATPRLRKALEEAASEAAGHDRATTSADLLVGILRAEIGVGYQLLRSAGVSLSAVREAMTKLADPRGELHDVVDTTPVAILEEGTQA
jgi:ATP-dependent Clp protease ATP-binding subunit ClpA